MSAETRKIEIYREADAPALLEAGCITLAPGDALQTEGVERLAAAGFSDGDEIKVLVNIPGFSLAHVWFKQNFPLPLHSHDGDCLYYVVAGSLQLGVETLGPRDCFLIPAHVPYTYTPGPEGVEVLEIRHETHFEYRNHAKTRAFYDRALETVVANVAAWRTAKRPSDRA